MENRLTESYFLDKDSSLETHWRSIVLLGRNVASYKFALAKTLLEFPTTKTLITLEELALPFAKNISEHLKTNDKQVTGPSSKFLDYCRQFNNRELNEEQLREYSSKLGFVNVIDAFHNVAGGEVQRFFEDARKKEKGITLTDNFYRLFEAKQQSNLKNEVDSRWHLWETAIAENINPRLLEINPDFENDLLYVLDAGNARIDVTSSRGALNGYQKSKCFYCHKPIEIQPGLENSCDVDHFFPHILKKFDLRNIDQIWNLVLACKECNRGRNGKFDRIPDIQFLEELHRRNNFYIESHHPLRETMIIQTGKTSEERIRFLQKFSDDAVDIIPVSQKWKPSDNYGSRL